MKFRDRLVHFMMGRYGIDALGRAMFWLYLALVILGMFISNIIYSLVVFVFGAYMIFRMFSRNRTARQKENLLYLRYKTKFDNSKFGKWLDKRLTRLRNITKKRYRRCPHCKAELCLPRKRGKHTVHCPRCKKDFPVHIIL